MKKALLGTTALVGASIAMMGIADAAKTKVSVKGKLKISMALMDQDIDGMSSSKNAVNSVGSDRGITIVTDSELRIRAQGKTDAGMNWRATLEIEADGSAGGGASNRRVADDTHLRLWGSWGMLMLGSIDGAGDKMSQTSGKYTYGTGGSNGDWPRYVNRKSVNSRFVTSPKGRDSGDAAKIVYYTPRVAGFQAGWSWAPDRGDEGAGRSGDDFTLGTVTDSTGSLHLTITTIGQDESNFHEVGINYIAKHGGVSVATSFTGFFAENEHSRGPQAAEDTTEYAFHAILGYGGFKVGGMYVNNGDSRRTIDAGDDDSMAWDVGVGYSKGPIGISYVYYRAEIENQTTSTNDDDTQTIHLVGATYKLAKGVSLHAEYFHYESEEGIDARGTADDNEADVIILGITTSW